MLKRKVHKIQHSRSPRLGLFIYFISQAARQQEAPWKSIDHNHDPHLSWLFESDFHIFLLIELVLHFNIHKSNSLHISITIVQEKRTRRIIHLYLTAWAPLSVFSTFSRFFFTWSTLCFDSYNLSLSLSLNWPVPMGSQVALVDLIMSTIFSAAIHESS